MGGISAGFPVATIELLCGIFAKHYDKETYNNSPCVVSYERFRRTFTALTHSARSIVDSVRHSLRSAGLTQVGPGGAKDVKKGTIETVPSTKFTNVVHIAR